MDNKQKIVMVFGVFDILHDGHRHFLRESKKLGGQLIAVLPSDLSVKELKGRPPLHTLSERIKNLEREGLADKIISGDEVLESWGIIDSIRPDIIALGYDQKKLAEALMRHVGKLSSKIEIVIVTPHTDTSLHSEALRKKM